MNIRHYSLVLAIVAMSFSSALADHSDFFFSFSEGGVNGNQTMDFATGDTGSLFVYWSTNGPADSDLSVGAFIDVFTDTAGVIQFTSAETFDYQITVAGTPIGNRLLDANGGGGAVGAAGSVSADFIDEMRAFTVTGGPGILESNNGSGAFLDSGYDASNDAFNWGRIDFTVVGASGTSTNVTGAAGDGMIVNGASVVDAAFSTATINVGGDIIPEPTTAGLLAIGLAGLVARRRR